MIQKLTKFKEQLGFTLVELMVVLAIMAILASVVIVDFNRQRQRRSVVLSHNEFVTNFRKVQSYTLSSRNISPGVAAKFYIITVPENSGTYTIEAVDEEYNIHPIETITMPAGVEVEDIDLSGAPTFFDNPRCIQIAFSVPFGKMYMNGNRISCPTTQSLVTILRDPVDAAALRFWTTRFRLSYNSIYYSHYITVNYLSGRISPN